MKKTLGVIFFVQVWAHGYTSLSVNRKSACIDMMEIYL